MKEVIDNTQARLADLQTLRYVDEDWGQLDYYSPNFPVQWPCALIDVASAQYSDVGKDRNQTPQNRQMADCLLTLTVADLRLSNTSAKAPVTQKNNTRSIHLLIEEIHTLLHGWKPTYKASSLLRRGVQRVKRDDGVQEYTLTYAFGITNV